MPTTPVPKIFNRLSCVAAVACAGVEADAAATDVEPPATASCAAGFAVATFIFNMLTWTRG